MERNPAFRLISLTEIDSETPYCLRYDCRDSGLAASLENQGIRFPLLLRKAGERAVLLSGHKRFFYAQRKKWKEAPAFFIEGKFSEKEFYLFSLHSNWNQNWPDLDRMTAVRKGGEDFGLTSEELRKEVLPALGLASGRGTLEDYRRAAGLSAEIHRLIHEGRIPFKGAASLARFPASEQGLLAEAVLGKVHLTVSQLLLVSEWLSDLKKIRRAGVQDLLGEGGIQSVLEHPKMDFRAKGDRFFFWVRLLRFPRLSAQEKNFQSLI